MSLSVLRARIATHLNFFRVHLLFFTFTPLVFAAIFYAANGATHVPFIDALFICFSATTYCGLVTADLSSFTGFQQALLFFLTSIGHIIVVSWVMVYIRRWYFDKHLMLIVESDNAKRKALTDSERREAVRPGEGFMRRVSHGLVSRTSPRREDTTTDARNAGNVENEKAAAATQPGLVAADQQASILRNERCGPPIRLVRTLSVESRGAGRDVEHMVSDGKSVGEEHFTVPVVRPGILRAISSLNVVHDDREYVPPGGGVPFRRFATQASRRTERSFASSQRGTSVRETFKNREFGGFPYPTTILYRLFKRAFARVRRDSEKDDGVREGHSSNYFSSSFGALDRRNFQCHGITQEDLEEMAGVEYRALNALLWIIAVYHLAIQSIAFIIVAPYMSMPRWGPTFEPPNLHRYVPTVWYSAFQIMSAFTTSGMSLVDQSMVPFQTAYPLIFVCAFLIIAGNLAYPCFLRFFIWAIKLCVRGTSLEETLQFLLDHPRRCYFYLFPSFQTWLLLAVVVLQNTINYLFFLVLNIGVASFEAIPLGVRFAIGILQGTAVRAAGFATTAMGSVAPGLQVWFVIMMYIGVYPIGLSVQATNVYEEKSLGIVEEDDNGEDVEGGDPDFVMYRKYLALHARKQLAFDMWWLGLVLFLLCIIERDKIQDEVNYQWFTIFALIFEITSAYAGVGISLGVPYANYSFSGALSTLSKLILIAVMIRGRHRGLPVAIDRAVLLPHEYKKVAPEPSGVEGAQDRGMREGGNSKVAQDLIADTANAKTVVSSSS